MTIGLTLLTGALSAPAGAQPSKDLTGVYTTNGGELAILQADNESFVYYSGTFPQGSSVGICECLLAVQQKKSPTEWLLRGSDSAEDSLALRFEPGKLKLEGDQPDCCGARWPGANFSQGNVKPAKLCKVKAPKAYFYAMDEGNTQRKAFVVAGDSVEVYLPAEDPDLVPARFKGPKKATAGLLKKAELDCEAKASTPKPSPAPANKGSDKTGKK